MGGDHGPTVTVAAAARALACHASLELVLVGDEETVRAAMSANGIAGHARVTLEHATQVVEMHEKPSQALRGKRDSSMRKAIDLVKDGSARACVSAGNTGALMAIARFVLKTLPGIDRPAICATMPGLGRTTHVLDLGANVDSTSEELFRFAVMGAVLAEAVDNRAKPSVALLNIGEEEIKGNDRVKQTALLLEQSALNYVGFVEGNDIFAGKVDVIVCDGFVGNVALKASEGVARMLSEMAREELTRALPSGDQRLRWPPPEALPPVELAFPGAGLLAHPRPRVVISTDRGELEFELFAEEAPQHVANFLARAESYRGTTFHRVVSDFVVQGGDARGDGNGGASWRGDALRHEITPRKYVRGSLGMPRNEDWDSGGSQLFVTHRMTPHLDGRYTIFGELVKGFDVLDLLDLGDVIREVRVIR